MGHWGDEDPRFHQRDRGGEEAERPYTNAIQSPRADYYQQIAFSDSGKERDESVG